MLKYFKVGCDNSYEVKDLRKFYHGVYKRNHKNPSNCKSFEDITTSLIAGKSSVYWDCYVLLMWEDETIVGGSLYYYMRSTNVAFIEFLSVLSDCRGKGYGTELFNVILDDLNIVAKDLGYSKVKYIFSEMIITGNAELPYLNFGNSLGFRRLKVDYIQPLVAYLSQSPEDIYLIGRTSDESVSFDKDVVISAIWSYYSYAFDVQHAEHSSEYKTLVDSIRNVTEVSSISLLYDTQA